MLVVDHGGVERVEDLGQLVGACGAQGRSQVGHGVEHGLDLGRMRCVGTVGLEAAGRVIDRGAAVGKLLDALLGERDYRCSGS